MEKKTPFKELSSKQKFVYIWDYYRIPIAIILVIIITVAYYLHGALNPKNKVLGVLCINSIREDNVNDSGLYDDFLIENGFDPSKDAIIHNGNISVNISNPLSYQQTAVLDAYFTDNQYDICFADPETFEYYTDNCAFVPISNYLDEETLKKYEDDLVYATDTETNIEYPCGITIDKNSSEWLEESGLYDECTVGVCFNESNPSLITNFLNTVLN